MRFWNEHALTMSKVAMVFIIFCHFTADEGTDTAFKIIGFVVSLAGFGTLLGHYYRKFIKKGVQHDRNG